VQAAFEKVIGAFDDDQLLRFRQRVRQRLQLGSRAELVAGSTHEQLGLRTIMEEFERVYARIFGIGGDRSDWNSQADCRTDSRVWAGGPQTNGSPEREPSKNQRQMVLRIQPLERSLNVFDFTFPIVVFAFAQSGPAKVKTQNGESKTVQRLHGMKDDLVMQGTAEQRMRMADHRCVRGRARARIQQGFEPTSGSVEKQ